MTPMFINNFASDISIIAREKLTGLGEHWGVLLPNGLVAHNTDDKGPHYVTLQEFQAGKSIKVIRKVPPAEHQSTFWRIQQEINNPQGYHLSANNCEIFANRVTGNTTPVDHQNQRFGCNDYIGEEFCRNVFLFVD